MNFLVLTHLLLKKLWCNRSACMQGFIRAVFMSGRRHKKLNLLISFQTQSSSNLMSKHIGVELAFIINWLTKFASIFSNLIVFRCKKNKTFQGFYLTETPPGPHYEQLDELTAPWYLHLHFTIFKNSIFV